MFKRLLPRRQSADSAKSTAPPGRRVYAIGDVHGCIDKLEILIAQIDADDAARASAETTLIFLGDLIDRGPDSAAVIERVRRLSGERDTRLILGNHEELLLAAIAGEPQAIRTFCRVGGRETLLSYGVGADEYERLDYREVLDRLRAVVPATHLQFLRAAEDMIVIGDYAFVHAGVRPGVRFADQRTSDLRWIRDTFLDHTGTLEHIVVHGHTIEPEAAFRRHRIGIDTGAYAGGPLTALGVESDDRWVLQAG